VTSSRWCVAGHQQEHEAAKASRGNSENHLIEEPPSRKIGRENMLRSAQPNGMTILNSYVSEVLRKYNY